MAHIVSDYTIGTTLAINLRQTTSLAFVTLTENGSDTSVKIDASEEEAGEYSLTLESFNTLSTA